MFLLPEMQSESFLRHFQINLRLELSETVLYLNIEALHLLLILKVLTVFPGWIAYRQIQFPIRM